MLVVIYFTFTYVINPTVYSYFCFTADYLFKKEKKEKIFNIYLHILPFLFSLFLPIGLDFLIWCCFPLAWRTSSVICWNVNLLVTHLLSFHLAENFFNLPSFLRDNFLLHLLFFQIPVCLSYQLTLSCNAHFSLLVPAKWGLSVGSSLFRALTATPTIQPSQAGCTLRYAAYIGFQLAYKGFVSCWNQGHHGFFAFITLLRPQKSMFLFCFVLFGPGGSSCYLSCALYTTGNGSLTHF